MVGADVVVAQVATTQPLHAADTGSLAVTTVHKTLHKNLLPASMQPYIMGEGNNDAAILLHVALDSECGCHQRLGFPR